MGLMNIFRKSSTLQDSYSPASIYELLFCDDIDLYKRYIRQPDIYPWIVLFSDYSSNQDLESLISDPSVESRVRLLAYRKLFLNGKKPKKKELLGVVVEVGLEKGTDVLASFSDGTARYINQSGKIIIWDMSDKRSDFLTKELFYESESIVKKIGPWDKQARLAPPGRGLARISFLMSDGLYFGQGPMNDLFHDPLSGPALNVTTLLMQHITERALQQNQ